MIEAADKRQRQRADGLGETEKAALKKKRSSGKCEEQSRARRNNQVSVEQREKAAAAVGFQTGGEQTQSCSVMKPRPLLLPR